MNDAHIVCLCVCVRACVHAIDVPAEAVSRSSASNRTSDCEPGGPGRSASDRGTASVSGVNVDGGGALAVNGIGPAVREMCSDCSIFAFIIKASCDCHLQSRQELLWPSLS